MQRKAILIVALVLALTLWAMPALGAYKFEQLPSGKFLVTFTYQTAASEVYLVGQFNDWNTKDPNYKMTKNADGVYEITIELAKGVYEYKFFADGEWKSDPDNPVTVPPFGNSVATISAGSLKGEVAIKGEMNNEFKQVDKGAIAFNNDLKLQLEGTLQEVNDDQATDRFQYMTEFMVENKVKNVEDPFSYQSLYTPGNLYVNKFNLTLLQKYANTSLQGNINDDVNSFDYLGLVDVTTSKDDRDNYNINDTGDSLRLRITPGSGVSNGWDYNLTLAKYAYDITKSSTSSVKKYYTGLNLKKDFTHYLTGAKVGEVGFTGFAYQPVVLGEAKDIALTGAVFGSWEPFDNFTVRAEYAHVPTGDISESLTGAYDYNDQSWKFVFNAYEYPDIADIKPISEIEEVHVVGAFNEGAAAGAWNPADKSYAMTQVADGIWEILIPKTDINANAGYKFIFDADSWDAGHECGQNGHVGPGGSDLYVGQVAEDIPIKQDAQAYMAEVNYRIFDPRRSFRLGSEAYKFDVTVGYKALQNGAYLPIAVNDLYKMRGTGFNKAYLSTYYYPLNNDLKLTFDSYYQTYYEDWDKFGYGANLGFDFPAPVSFLAYVKGNVERHDFKKAEGWIYGDENIIKDNNVREYNRLFLEAKTNPYGWVNYFTGNVQYTNKIADKDLVKLFAEAELLFPIEQIAYLKGNIDYVLGDPQMAEGEERLPRFWVEGKVHHLPVVQDYITHILVNYEYDKGEIKDHSWYGDDDNDWDQRIYGETKFVLPQLPGFEVKVSGESRKIEENKYPADQKVDEDSQYYVARERAFIDWYTFMTIGAGYEFPFGLRIDASLKYDLNHNEIHKYEDDAIKVELTQPIGEYSTLKASYNAKHPDHSSKECISLKLQTLF